MYLAISRLPAFAVPSLVVVQSEQIGEEYICGRVTSSSDKCHVAIGRAERSGKDFETGNPQAPRERVDEEE